MTAAACAEPPARFPHHTFLHRRNIACRASHSAVALGVRCVVPDCARFVHWVPSGCDGIHLVLGQGRGAESVRTHRGGLDPAWHVMRPERYDVMGELSGGGLQPQKVGSPDAYGMLLESTLGRKWSTIFIGGPFRVGDEQSPARYEKAETDSF